MKIELNFLKSIIIILSIACSLVYFDPSIPETDILEIDEGEYISEKDIILQYINGDDDLDASTIDGNKPIGVLSSTTIEGNYALAGYFTHDQFTTLDDDGSVYVLEDFKDMRNKAALTVSSTFEMDTTGDPTWPDQEDTYMPLKDLNDLSPDTLSSMFTPVYWESTLIKGKIHVLTHISTNYIGIIDPPQIKVSVSIFNPQDGNTTEIASYEEILPDDLSDLNQKIFELTLNDTYTIPAGNRLKLTFEGKMSDLSDLAIVGLDSSSKGSGLYDWDITDEVYSNSYTFNSYNRILGMQIYYKSATFPEITVSGITNSTYYYEEKNIDISVTGADECSYRWDLDNYTSFTDVASTSLPTTEGWHYLEVRASDSFNNTAIEVYEVGYDSTECYLILNDPINNSIIESESLLNFSTYGANSIICEWDKNGTEIELLSLPDYNLAVPITEGYHNLTLILNDIFVLEDYYYVFGIDANAPHISLVNLLNDTSIIYAAGKMLEVNITDFSPNVEVNYKWDDDSFLPWTPSEGTIYRTYLPDTFGYHNLTITAEDQFGLLSTNFYMFNVSTETLLVELRTMLNESWYYGGDTIEVTVSGTNNTLIFSWDGNSFQDGNPFLIGGQILTLDGVNALSTDINYYHYLTIIVGSIDNEEKSFVFEFKIDTENPVIDSSILDYNNNRFKNSDTFIFIISDNATLTDKLLVLISIDGNQNITLNSPYELDLALFSE
ncbi:MAG: hypothetical protein KAS95_05660, partial [Candidatus Heimdallarchaeota archaeon]|nr:hypothetical protein [Candidatus Heimdallarchaeota archaeon]